MNSKSAPCTKDILLAVDTSGPRLQLALNVDGKTISFCEKIAKGHAEILFDRLQGFLEASHFKYQDLSKIAVTTGPGSFTGLRIGIAAARGLGLALKRPVVGIPNLLALSLGMSGSDFSIVVDARREQFYAQSFTSSGITKNAPELLNREQLEEKWLHEPILSDPQINIEQMAVFASQVDQGAYPPSPTYVRAADAKPQTRLRIERA